MKVQIIPQKRSVLIVTKKTNDNIYSSLTSAFRNNKNIRIHVFTNSFVIEKTLWNSSRSQIIANGSIKNEAENTIRLRIIAKDSAMFYFAVFWYFVNLLMTILIIYIFIMDRTFSFSILLPIALIILGYGLTT